MKKVKDLEIGEKIKFNNTYVYVREILKNKVLVSKQKTGFALLSISFFSHKFEDLYNRVEY